MGEKYFSWYVLAALLIDNEYLEHIKIIAYYKYPFLSIGAWQMPLHQQLFLDVCVFLQWHLYKL
jgi:hypothetical protein